MKRLTQSAQSRSSLDKRFKQLGSVARYKTPVRGWIKAIREALGMTTAQLAKNLRFRFNGANQRRTGGLTLPNIDSNLGTSSDNATTFNPRAQTFTKTFNDAYSAVFDWNLNSATYVNVTTGLLSYGSHTEFACDPSNAPAGGTSNVFA